MRIYRRLGGWFISPSIKRHGFRGSASRYFVRSRGISLIGSEAHAIRVVRVVVVDVARVVDIPHVVRVAAIRRTQARIAAYSPISKLYVFIAFGI